MTIHVYFFLLKIKCYKSIQNTISLLHKNVQIPLSIQNPCDYSSILTSDKKNNTFKRRNTLIFYFYTLKGICCITLNTSIVKN